MSGKPTDAPEPLPASDVIPGPGDLRQYPAHDLVVWQPKGVLDDRLLDEVGEWLCVIEEESAPSKRFVDLSQLTQVAVRTHHVFEFALKRTAQSVGAGRAKSALFSDDWIGFGIACLYESMMKGTQIEARAFRDRADAAVWIGVPEEVLKLEEKRASRTVNG